MTKTQSLTQVEFQGKDFDRAETIARHLGYTQTAYTSTSALWGLICLPENPELRPRAPHRHACIINTIELGLVVVQTVEDLGLHEIDREQHADVMRRAREVRR